MELELMFSDQKWNILKCLSEGKFSPMQLAEKLNTTIANISQQLRLLEATDLVKKEKIKNRDRGKPRALFSLTQECAYLIPTANNFASKKLIKVTDHHKIILSIWFLENVEFHSALEKIYWKIKPMLSKITAIFFNKKTTELVIACENAEEIKKIAGQCEFALRILQTGEALKLFQSSKGVFSDKGSLHTILIKQNFNGGAAKHK